MSGVFINAILLCICLFISFLFIWFYIKSRRMAYDNKLYLERLNEMDRIIDQKVRDRTKKLEEIRDNVSGYAVQKFEIAQELSLRNLEILKQKDYNAKQSEKLRLAFEKIQKLDSFREQIVRMMIHDLKNPLNVILNLTDNDAIPLKPRSLIRQISFEMLDLILNILEVQKFEEMKMKMEKENINLISLIRDTVDKFSYLLVNSSIELKANVPPTYWINADRHIVSRVFTNLLSNAIKYTPSGGEVVINANQQGEMVHIDITDNGKGIHEDDMVNLFQMYGQGEKTDAAYSTSTGIGLAYCKLAIEALGGKIGLNSEHGTGTTVWFLIPMFSGISKGESESFLDSIELKISEFRLTDEDIEYLKPYKLDLQAASICEISNILDLIGKIDCTGNERIMHWKESLEETLFSANEKRYKELINL